MRQSTRPPVVPMCCHKNSRRKFFLEPVCVLHLLQSRPCPVSGNGASLYPPHCRRTLSRIPIYPSRRARAPEQRAEPSRERHGLHVQHVLAGGRVRKSTLRTTRLCAEAMEQCARLDLKRSPASRDRLGHTQRCRLALTFSPEVGAAASGSAAQTQLLRRGPSHQLDPGLAGILQPLGTWLCFRPELAHGAGLPRQRVRVRAGTTHSP